jgi:uroporphyrinogen decarboxylase
MLDVAIKPDIEGLLRNLRREGTPDRTYFIELFLDREVEDAIIHRYDLVRDLDEADPHFPWKRQIALYRFLGYECINYAIPEFVFPRDNLFVAEDTAALARGYGRLWVDEAQGVITSWEDFERYPWPDASTYTLDDLEWLERSLPDDMGIAARCHSVFEEVTWLMSYQGLCYVLYDQPDLVDAMFRQVGELHAQAAEILVQFDRIRLLFGGDDMGFKTSTMIPARVLIEKSLPWHERMARLAHQRGKLYLLHTCGNLAEIMPALIEQVRIDGRHSFEDAIEPVAVAKKRWGDRVALLGGIDMDFICRASETQIRERVRETLEVCLPGGGFCLGTGNTMANYVPLDNYLVMLDEGRKCTA